MGRIVSTLKGLLGLIDSAKASLLSSSEFSGQFIQILEGLLPQSTITEIKDLEIVLTDAEGRESKVFLHNAYSEYQRDPTSKDQLLERYARSAAESKGMGPSVSMLTAGGDYVASLLLFDDLWSGDRLKVEGEIVVAIPSRDVLLLTGSRSEAGVEQLRRMADKAVKESSYSLTATLFVYRQGQFQVFTQESPASHRLQ